MQRPPQFPPLLFSRQAYQWINRINRKFQDFSAMALPTVVRESLREELEAAFLSATLTLTGTRVSRAQAQQVVQFSLQDQEQPVAKAPEKAACLHLLRGLRLVEERARTEGQSAALTVDLFVQLHDPTGHATLRRQDSTNSSVRAAHLPIVLENTCRWFSMPSIAELNPVEQAAIALLRLLEISPFEQFNERTALLAASLFPLRRGLPPVILVPEWEADYHKALKEATQMNTQPMVELVARAVEQSLDEMLRMADKER